MSTGMRDTQPRTRVSLRVFGEHIDPDAISAKVGLPSDHQHRVGDPIGATRDGIYQHSMWALRSTSPANAPLEVHLEDILSRIESNEGYFQALSQHATVDFYCTIFWDKGFGLSPRTLGRIASLGAALGVVIYNRDSNQPEDDSPSFNG